MRKNPFETHLKKTALAAFIAAAVFVGVAGYFFLTKQATEHPVPPEFVVFNGLPQNASIKATLKNNKGTQNLSVQGQTVLLTEIQRKTFKLPYRLDVRIEEASKIYDLSWQLEKGGLFYKILLDGLKPFQPLSLLVNERPSTGHYAADWSGRTTLDIILDTERDMNVCVKVDQSDFGFCQLNLAKPKAVI